MMTLVTLLLDPDQQYTRIIVTSAWRCGCLSILFFIDRLYTLYNIIIIEYIYVYIYICTCFKVSGKRNIDGRTMMTGRKNRCCSIRRIESIK